MPWHSINKTMVAHEIWELPIYVSKSGPMISEKYFERLIRLYGEIYLNVEVHKYSWSRFGSAVGFVCICGNTCPKDKKQPNAEPRE